MKIPFLIIFSIVILYCLNTRVINESVNLSDKEERDQFIEKLTEQEFLTGNKNDIIFLNLAFGMSKDEAQEKMKILEKENILNNISTHLGVTKASYTLSYNDYLNSGRIYLFFKNNKLQEMQIDTTEYNIGKLKALFIQKYGTCNYSANIDGNEECHWINGNRHISFIERASNKSILIQYIDTTDQMNEQKKALIKYAGLENKIFS